MDESELRRHLVAFGDALDRAGTPVDLERLLDTACKVVSFTVTSPAPDSTSTVRLADRPRWLRLALAGAGAALVAAVLIFVWPRPAGDDRSSDDRSGVDAVDERPTGPSEPPSTPPTSQPGGRTGDASYSPTVDVPLTASADEVPEVGVAVEDGRDVVLLDLDGRALGRGSWPGHPLDSGFTVRTYDLDVDPARLAPQSIALPPSGSCYDTAGAGGIHTGLCPRTEEQWGDLADQYRMDQGNEIRVIDPSGESRFLASAPEWDPDLGINWHHGWSAALPSPDGRWVLADWQRDCYLGTAFLAPTDGGDLRTVTGEAGIHWMSAPASAALGWTPDGRAIVTLDHSSDPVCEVPAGEPGVYLVDPDSGEMELIHELGTPDDYAAIWYRQDGNPTRRERLLEDAFLALGVQRCCDDPSSSGRGASLGLVWEGSRIKVNARPRNDAPNRIENYGEPEIVPLDDYGDAALFGDESSALVQFVCDNTVYALYLRDEEEQATLSITEQRDRLLNAAEALVPYLYCTVGDPLP